MESFKKDLRKKGLKYTCLFEIEKETPDLRIKSGFRYFQTTLQGDL